MCFPTIRVVTNLAGRRPSCAEVHGIVIELLDRSDSEAALFLQDYESDQGS